MISPNQLATVLRAIEIDCDTLLIPEEESGLPNNYNPYAPIRSCAVPLVQRIGVCSRELFNRSAPDGGLKKKRSEDGKSRSKTGLTHYDQMVNVIALSQEIGIVTFSKIDNGNIIMFGNIAYL